MDGVANGKSRGGEQVGLHHALPVILGQAPLHQLGNIDPLPAEGVEPDDQVAGVVRMDGGVYVPGALGILHPRHGGQGVDIVVGEAQGGQHPGVHEPGAVKVVVSGILHIRGSGAQSGQEGHRQGGQQKQR